VPAPDVNTNAQIMAWIQDTFLSMIPPRERNRNIHVVTGKPIASGGSLGRDKATGQGVVFCIEKWAEDSKLNLNGATYFVQGFGNVGSWASRLLKRLGSVLIAVEDHTGAIADPNGIDADELSENQITADTAPLLNVRLVAEGANGPTDPDGDRIMLEKGIGFIPDILCNAGGVIVSYFEWLQNKRSEAWELEEVDEKLLGKITKAYELVKDTAKRFETDWRTAAYIVALTRLEAVYKEHGIFP